MSESAEHLLELRSDILEYSKLEASTTGLSSQRVLERRPKAGG